VTLKFRQMTETPCVTVLLSEKHGATVASLTNNLGNALYVPGERESGTARLETAMPSISISHSGRQTAPRRIIRGIAGKREAVSVYRAALAAWTRERVPLAWAMTHDNLGNAL
jgi:hypothetical protein